MEAQYAVACGHKTGIFSSWEETQPLVKGYSGAKYKKFWTREAAQEYLDHYEQVTATPKRDVGEAGRVEVYTDGSHCEGNTGFGLVILYPTGEKQTISGNLPATTATSNVAELYAIYVGLSITEGDILVCSDSDYAINTLLAIYAPRTGKTAPNSELIEKIQRKMTNRCIELRHVKAHSKIEHNEEADRLAKRGRLAATADTATTTDEQ